MAEQAVSTLSNLYAQVFGGYPASVEPIGGGGSSRSYYRLRGAGEEGSSVVGAVGSDAQENDTFIRLSRHFLSQGLPVPEVLAISDDGLCYLQTDLGALTLYDAVSRGRELGGQYSPEEETLLAKAMELLPAMQVRGAEGMDWQLCRPIREMDSESVFFDLNYFKYCFLRTSPLSVDEPRLEADFRAFASDLCSTPSRYFLHRDFQARNVMLAPSGEVSLIDFQGGRRGPLEYDVVSFLHQASARYPSELRRRLLGVYLQALARYAPVDEGEFLARLPLFVLLRLVQVLGAYGLRGRFEGKDYFLRSIPHALSACRRLIGEHRFRYAYLTSLLLSLADRVEEASPPTTPSQSTTPTEAPNLTVQNLS